MEIAKLYDFNLVLIIRNRESSEIYSFRSNDLFQLNIEDIISPYKCLYYTISPNNYQLTYPKSRNKLPKDIKKIKRKKERQKLRGIKRRAKLLSKGYILKERDSYR